MDKNKRDKLIEDIKIISKALEEKIIEIIEELGDDLPEDLADSAFYLLLSAYTKVAVHGLEDTLTKNEPQISVILKNNGEIN
jgi:hypothetical protein